MKGKKCHTDDQQLPRSPVSVDNTRKQTKTIITNGPIPLNISRGGKASRQQCE